jgi:hypothetical protein
MVTPVMPEEPSSSPAPDRAWMVASALLPAFVAAAHLDVYADGGRDVSVVRTVGLGYVGGFRALDAWIAALFAAVPLGTRTLRAELPGVFLVAVTAALMFAVVRASLARVAGTSSWSSVVAAIATATVSLSYPFQHEASNAGSSLAGVVLVLGALVLAGEASLSWPWLACLVTLGLTYEPAVGLCIVAVVLMTVLLAPKAPRDPAVPSSASPLIAPLSVVFAGACGLVPFVFSVIRTHVSPLSTSARFLALPHNGGGPDATGFRHAAALMDGELGEVLLLLAALGLVRGLLQRQARPTILPLAVLTAVACLATVALGVGGRESWSSVGLVALFGIVAFAAIAMQEGVVRVARARLPLASASAAMVIVLEVAFPAILLDDGLARASMRAPHALSTWEDASFAGLPSGTLLLISAPRLYTRLLATRASGDFPADLALIPTFDPANEASAAALAHDPRLVPLFRDLALTGIPEELSLSTLAAARPLALATDPRWDRSLTRHMLPAGLLASFEPEPRGGADRKHALDASASSRARLAADLGNPPAPALASLTASILFDRALAAVQTGEREVALRALEDASVFAPKDVRIQHLMLKETSTRGPVDVRDLVREGLSGEAP